MMLNIHKHNDQYKYLYPLPSFLVNLYDILSRKDLEHIISWSPDGCSFVIFNFKEFTSKVIPQYFKHNNYSSFVR